MNIPLPNGRFASLPVTLAIIAFRLLIRTMAIFLVYGHTGSLLLALGAAASMIPVSLVDRLFGYGLRRAGLVREGCPACAPDPDKPAPPGHGGRA